jgi:hypothetical protein
MTRDEMGALADRIQRQCLAVLNTNEIDMTGAEQRTVTFAALELVLVNVLLSTANDSEDARGLLARVTLRVLDHVDTADWPKVKVKRVRLAQSSGAVQ